MGILLKLTLSCPRQKQIYRIRNLFIKCDWVWLFTDEEANCTVDKVYSNFANSFKNEIEDLWHPNGGIYTSTEACYNENQKVNGKFVNGKMIFSNDVDNSCGF